MIGPGDLIALVTFDGAVYPNLAVTRERLGRPQQAPHALAAALTHWLRRRDLWLEVRGRQIHGIATARSLAGPGVWQIDTLIDAGDGDGPVLGALLAQAEKEALRSAVRMLLLRMPAAHGEAIADVRARGFEPVLAERLWRAPNAGRAAVPARESTVQVRAAEDADWFGRFQLCERQLPPAARRVIAPTYEQWRAMLEEQWLGRRSHDAVAIEAWPHRRLRQLRPLSGRGADRAAGRQRRGRRRAAARRPAAADRGRAAVRAHARGLDGRRGRARGDGLRVAG